MANYQDIMGIRDLRLNLANVLDEVTNRYSVITAEDKIKTGRRASIISTDMLKELMDCYNMAGEVRWDEATHQFYAVINEIEIDGVGDSRDEAVDMAIDNAEMAAENYFELIDMYKGVNKYRRMYPYFLKIKMADVFDLSLKDTLGFK